ncbi:MAG: hypothetical protein ACSHXK_16250 [Oceanococcus sp.]
MKKSGLLKKLTINWRKALAVIQQFLLQRLITKAQSGAFQLMRFGLPISAPA